MKQFIQLPRAIPLNRGLPDRFPLFAVEDIDPDGEDVVGRRFPADAGTGFGGEGDMVKAESHIDHHLESSDIPTNYDVSR